MNRDSMVRHYKSKPGAKVYKKHDPETIKKAIKAVERGILIRKEAEMYKIPKSVLSRHKNHPETRSQGGQTLNSTRQ